MAAATVVTVPGFSYPAAMGGANVNDPFTLYTTPNAFPVLIETVHLKCNYGGGAPSGDMWILRMLDAALHVLWSQATPAFTVNDIPGDVEVCWSRGAAETSTQPIVDVANQTNLNFTGFATVPLGDLILDSLSILQLQLIQNLTGGGSSAFTVAAPVVTYDDGGASSTSAVLAGIPLFTDATA